jgi:mannose-6-phosphate isomerase-like protein (cupin superfamily)
MKSTTILAFLTGMAVPSIPLTLAARDAHAPVPTPAVLPVEAASVDEMLEDFVADYRRDAMAQGPITFGILVKDAEDPEWHVVIAERTDDAASADVRLEIGFPDEPLPYFVTDVETLTKIHSGALASLTAMAKAFSTDFAPLDMDFMPDFVPGAQTEARMMVLSFHFWTRGFPEIVRFGDKALTRETHGGNGVLFYYQPGFRSGWFLISPGQHINENVDSRTNPFPTLIVCTKGRMRSKIGGVERELGAGEAVYIGPDISHEFWGIDNETAEGVLLMFGDGA